MGRILDGQVNIGTSYEGLIGDPQYYIQQAVQMGVTDALLFCTATDVTSTGTRAVWENDGLHTQYFDVDPEGGKTKAAPNPYTRANLKTIDLAESCKQREEPIRFYPVWKIHPVLDRPEDISAAIALAREKIFSLKVHGLASATGAEAMPSWLPELARKYDLPVVFHTDFFRGTPKNYLQQLYQRNTPLAYVQWAHQNRVKTVINHGARLDRQSLNCVAGSNDIVVMYGPDCHIESAGRTAITTEDYAADLFKMVDPRKVVFSTDYPWNRSHLEDERTERWDSVKRVRQNTGREESEMVLFGNASAFFNIP